MKRYSEYKDSGIEWIGEIPSHWKKSKVGYIGNYINGFAFNPSQWSDEGYKIIRIQNLTDSSKSFNFYSGKIDKKYIIKKGDILISWSATLDTFIWDDDEDAVLNQHIFKVVVDEDKICKSYYVWLANWFISEMQNEKHGSTMQHLTKNTFDKFVVYLPSMEEQVYLAKYLDKKTSQIDNLISKKEELIETLKASRTKLISETITKGLDKNVTMKNSGVEWIGEIPSHWETNRLKYICNINPQKSEVRLSKSSEVSFVPMENVSLNRLILDTDKELAEVYGGYTYFKDGDIVFAKVTPCFENGNMAIAKNLTNGVGFGSTELNVLRVDENIIDKEFLYYIIQNDKFKNEAIANMYGVAGLKRISTKFIEGYNVLLPPIEEQRKMIEFLNKKTDYIDKIVSKTEEQIEVLKKAKQKLITEVVTGKIDVTNL